MTSSGHALGHVTNTEKMQTLPGKLLYQDFFSLIEYFSSSPHYAMHRFRVRFFKKIQDWILKSERIRKRILRFFTQQINPRSLGSWCIKGTEESTLGVDSSAPLTKQCIAMLPALVLIDLMKNCLSFSI